MPHILQHMTDTHNPAHLHVVQPGDPARADAIMGFQFIVEHVGLNATKALLLLVEQYGLESVQRWLRNTAAAMGRTDL